MSGDVQPRKRKDKKRKKDDEDTVKETPAPKVTAGAAQAATQPGDIQMHVHNDHGTGGHWCAKVVFFILLTGLGALIGLIILENRGVSNADTPLSESRYAEYFDGWVDENREDDHHHEEILEALNQLDEHEDEEHGDHGGDDHGEEEEEDDGAPYAEEEDHDEERELEDEEDEGELPKLDDDEVEEIVATEKKVVRQEAQAAADDEDDDDDTNEGGYEADDDNQADAEEDEEENDEEEDEEEIEYNDEEADDFVDDGGDEDVDDDDDENDKEDDATKTTAKTVDDNDDDDQPDDDDDDNVNDGDDNDDGEDKDTGAGDFGDDGDDDNDDKEPELEQNDDDDDDQNDEDQDDNDQDSDDNHGLNEVDGDNDDDNDNDDGDNVDDEELDNDDDDDNEPAVADRQTDGDADDDDNDNQTADDGDDDDDADEIDQLAGEDDDDDDDTVEGNSPFDEENQTNALNDQANKLRPRDVVQNKTEEVIVDKDAGIEKTVRTRDSMKDETPVEPIVSAELLKTQMDDLVENYNKLAEMMNLPKEETFVQKDPNQVNHKDDDDQVNEDDKKPTTANDNNDDDDEDDDDNDDFENFVDNDGGEEEYLAKLRKEQEQRTQQKQQEEKAEPREESSQIPSRPSESQIYEEELNRARRHLDELKNPKKALEEYESLLRKHRSLVPALIGKARALDALAEQQQSNTLLGEAIEAYRDVVFLGKAVDDETVKVAGERCIDRSRFRGQYLKVVDVHQELIRRFDSEPKFRNQLAVTYLLANRLAEAKAVLHETLMRWIDDGFALVHYGFVLKNHDKDMELAAQYLREGIETEQEGTQDGRFYFHLGDALQRLGLQQEALDVYRKGAEKKLFLSMYQRSLYNVDSLKSRPFWTIEQTTYAAQLELIRSQWTAIRDEGLKLLNSAGNFKDEAENLRDTGDWKQFELFFRGHRIDKNCAKAPLTCRLVEQFAAARSCKRGQVKFSVMHPGTHVWPHCGPTNCRIRAHLGLKVPSGTFIRVAEETRSWENGKWLIFDDSFEHEVWHNGTSTRLVLIVDFWHPDLTESQRKSLSPI
nr:aspartyl/asparaginyl beta-hydroxylase isoform X5 [Aedes albopictus]